MEIKEMKTINVLNYNQNIVVISTKHDGYAIDPATSFDMPTVLPLTLDEILYINGSSNAFKTGLLRFEKEIEKEMYEDYLKIYNWKEIPTLKEIENIILHPTVDGLTKIVNIKDGGLFDRVRAVFVRLKNTTNNDISIRVENIIEERNRELRRGIRNTAIIIKARDAVSTVSNEEIDDLKSQNKALQEQMMQMQKMMAEMLKSQNSVNTEASELNNEQVTSTVAKEEQKKKPGRPSKNK